MTSGAGGRPAVGGGEDTRGGEPGGETDDGLSLMRLGFPPSEAAPPAVSESEPAPPRCEGARDLRFLESARREPGAGGLRCLLRLLVSVPEPASES